MLLNERGNYKMKHKFGNLSTSHLLLFVNVHITFDSLVSNFKLT